MSRVLFEDSTAGDLTATGVELIHNGKIYTVQGKKEVIICAGFAISISCFSLLEADA